jgi:hypothetical protein
MAKRSKTREIYEKAYDHFEDVFSDSKKSQEWWTLSFAIDAFIQANPHKDYQRGVMAVFSAIANIRVGNDKESGNEQCVEAAVLMSFYWSGRHCGLRDARSR